jgi:NADPH:quinone reductase-like Zn-dependent oxidoreductase
MAMKAAIVRELGTSPVYGEFEEPTPRESEVRVSVTAAALTNLTRGRASGAHYSSAVKLPFIPGIDGVGLLDNGQRVYFIMPRSPFGAMGERTVVNADRSVPVPDGLDDTTAAAIANPGMSSWMALIERAKFVAGETVLVNGVTGVSGRLAVQIAKHLGAKRVIGTGRNQTALAEAAALGADVTIPLTGEWKADQKVFERHFGDGIDVVLDYLWGPSASHLLVAAAKAGPEASALRFVHVGGVSAPEISLPGAVLRSSNIQLMGSGLGSVPIERILLSVRGLLAATIPAGLRIATRELALADVQRGWAETTATQRTVFRTD